MKFNAKVTNKIEVENKKKFSEFLNKLKGKDVVIVVEKKKQQRSSQQNASLHLMFQQITAEMINNGQTMRDVMRKDFDIQPTPELIKEIWRTIQIAQTGKKSTTDLTKQEIDEVYEPFNKFIGEVLQIHCPFPSLEVLEQEQLK